MILFNVKFILFCLMNSQIHSLSGDRRNGKLLSRALYWNSRSPDSLVGIAMLLLAAIAPTTLGQTVQIYSITNLATLGMTDARDLNNQGQVVGNGGQHARLFSGGIMTDLGTLGGNWSEAFAINDGGEVVGTSEYSPGYPYPHAFRYNGGTMTDLGSLPGGNGTSRAYGINNGGQIVGVSSWPYGNVSFLYSSGTMLNFWPLTYGHYAVDINSGGQIVLNVTAPFFLACYRYSDGVPTEVGRFGGLTGSSEGTAINDSGQVVGWSSTNGSTHAFLYSGGQINDLGTLGGTTSRANDINNNGQIVGTSTASNGVTHGFIYNGGTMTDLSLIIPDLAVIRLEWDSTPGALKFSYTNSMTASGASSAWRPVAINDQGQILCSSGTLLTPIAPPSTSAKLYWANGTGIGNKLSDTPIFSQGISSGVGQGGTVSVPAASLQSPPNGATHVLLVIDPDNLIAESNEGNNTSALNITQPDLLPASIAWNTTNGGLDFSYTVQPGTLGIGSTTAKLFWANGTTIANKISNTAIFTQSIPAGFSGQSSIVHVPAANFESPPTNATHILLAVDSDSLVAEGDENNNTAALNITRPDLVPTLLAWNKADDGILFSYAVQPGNLGIGSTTVELFWANGPNLTNKISTAPIFLQNIPAGFSGESTNNQVAPSSFANPPTNASHILLVMDSANVVLESQEANNVLALAIAPPVSLAFKRVVGLALDVSPTNNIDSPARPIANLLETLVSQPALGLGVVADGVTPVLLHLIRSQGVDQPASYQFDLTINGLVLNDVIRQRLRILSSGDWTPVGSTMTVNFTAGQSNGFAFIEGIPMEDAMTTSVGGELTVTVKVMDGVTLLETKTYKVRRPPVVLVHGYNTDKRSWVSSFTNILNAIRPDFVIPVSYGSYPDGKGGFNNDANTYWSLEDNKDSLDLALQASIENPDEFPLRDWFFLRYDIVGHSQGGVLARMLCRTNHSFESNGFFSQKYPRGRFHRIITIGSPHNGSVIPYYLGKLESTDYLALPAVLGKVLQPKFNPFGPQIRMLNATHVDERAKFHCIRTSIDFDGNYSPGLFLAGLGPNRMSILLPLGSDGVVDLESQGGGEGTKNTTLLGEIIAHSGPLPVFVRSLLTFSGDYDTRSATVAGKVRDLLEGPPSGFGSFINPANLSPNRQTEIDDIVPISIIGDLITSAVGPQVVHHYNFQAQTLPGDVADGPFTWIADVFGADGADNSGVTLTVNTNNSSLASVSVDDSLVIGDVVLYVSYNSTNGSLVLGKPKLIASFPAGAVLKSLELRPRNISLEMSNSIPLEVWGSYTNGITRPLFTIGNPQFVFNSTAPSILAVGKNGVVTGVGLGSANLQVTYQGLSNTTTLSVVAAPLTPTNRITSGTKSNGVFTLGFQGAPSSSWWVLRSTELAGSWTAIGTVTLAGNGTGSFTDPNPPLLQAFYRLSASQSQPPVIMQQPVSRTNVMGSVATFTVIGGSDSPLTYQWRKNGTNLLGAISSDLSLTNVQSADAGNYDAILANSFGSVTSLVATLFIQTNTFSPLADLLAYYPFDGNANDASGHGRDGIVEGATLTSNRLGQANSAYAVTGSQYIRVEGLDPDNYAQGFSFGGWVRIVTVGGSLVYWIQDQGWGSSFILFDNGFNAVHFRCGSGNPASDHGVTGLPLAQNQWQHIFVTHGGSMDRFYVGGQLFGEWPAYPLAGNVSTLNIGWGGGAAVVDDIAVYGRELTASEVGNVYSATTLIPTQIPTITIQPQSRTNVNGTLATFAVSASGTAPLAYQWRQGGVDLINSGNISGVTSTNLTLTNIQLADGGGYSVVVSNNYGSVTSQVAVLTVTLPAPIHLAVPLRGTNAVTINVSGPPDSEWWILRASNLPGPWVAIGHISLGVGGTVMFTDTNLPPTQAFYRASSLLLDPPFITVQPQNRTNAVGTTVNLSVAATGASPLSYLWKKSGVALADFGNISGATTPTLILTNVQSVDAAAYTVVVTNSYGSVTSVVATITVFSNLNSVLVTGITATASSELAAYGRIAANAVNGIYYDGAFWESLGVNQGFGEDRNPAITFDLLTVRSLDKFVIWNGHEPPASVKRMLVKTSVDGTNFNSLGELILTNISPASQTNTLNGVSARYVRFDILENGARQIFPAIGAATAWSLVAIDEVEFYSFGGP